MASYEEFVVKQEQVRELNTVKITQTQYNLLKTRSFYINNFELNITVSIAMQ